MLPYIVTVYVKMAARLYIHTHVFCDVHTYVASIEFRMYVMSFIICDLFGEGNHST